MSTPQPPRSAWSSQLGFTLVELLVTMAITTVILGATMAAMADAVRATETATLLTGLNNGLRTGMDLIVRDLLQTGQGLPAGRVIFVPSGAGSQALRLPGPPTTNYQVVGATEWTAVIPGPGRGPVLNGQATDMITFIASDSAFDQKQLTGVAANALSIAVNPNGTNGANITNGGADDVVPGDLLMLTKGSTSTLAQVSRVVNQTIFFDPGDSLNLNQTAAADGTLLEVRNTAPVDPLIGAVCNPAPCIAPTRATRIRMITYYVDAVTDPDRPRLVRRMNNGHPTTFNNNLGTAVAFDIENLQITYDLADGVTNPANVRMTDADLDGNGACSPDPCNVNQIRKVNVLLAARSRSPLRGSNQFFRNHLLTQISLRSLAFVDEYQ
jgi:prepilin-type N-terminal cleavage/methylation domain-containing protein